MHHAARVRDLERVGHQSGDGNRVAHGDRAGGQAVGEGRPFDQLQHQREGRDVRVRWRMPRLDAVDRRDAGMIQ